MRAIDGLIVCHIRQGGGRLQDFSRNFMETLDSTSDVCPGEPDKMRAFLAKDCQVLGRVLLTPVVFR